MEYEHSGSGQSKGFMWAIWNIFTVENFLIALVAAFIGYAFFESLRKTLTVRDPNS